MNGKEYLIVQMSMIEMGKKLETLDFDGFLKSISNAQTTGPFLDPTLYQRAADNLDAIKKLAKAFRAARVEFENAKSIILKTAVAHMTKDIHATTDI